MQETYKYVYDKAYTENMLSIFSNPYQQNKQWQCSQFNTVLYNIL